MILCCDCLMRKTGCLLFTTTTPYQDFLEAIIRLSLIIVLPTDEEIEEGGVVDAGQYLEALENANL